MENQPRDSSRHLMDEIRFGSPHPPLNSYWSTKGSEGYKRLSHLLLRVVPPCAPLAPLVVYLSCLTAIAAVLSLVASRLSPYCLSILVDLPLPCLLSLLLAAHSQEQ
jgi:hypothetical protein